jgi:hypothetical protein
MALNLIIAATVIISIANVVMVIRGARMILEYERRRKRRIL